MRRINADAVAEVAAVTELTKVAVRRVLTAYNDALANTIVDVESGKLPHLDVFFVRVKARPVAAKPAREVTLPNGDTKKLAAKPAGKVLRAKVLTL